MSTRMWVNCSQKVYNKTTKETDKLTKDTETETQKHPLKLNLNSVKNQNLKRNKKLTSTREELSNRASRVGTDWILLF